MNNTFDIKRFGNYLLYDLRNAWNRYCVSLFICGLMPVIIFVFTELVERVVTGSWAYVPATAVGTAFVTMILLVTLSFPVKAYGCLTEKHAGSAWITLPASALEKWASMVVVTCVALPLCLGVLFIGSDMLLNALFPQLYGHTLIGNFGFFNTWIPGYVDSSIASMNIPAILYFSWSQNILAFTLGAMVFRTAKRGKTILCLLALGILMCIAGVGFFANTHIDVNVDPIAIEALVKRMNTFVNVSYAVTFALLLGATYYRMKTIKH